MNQTPSTKDAKYYNYQRTTTSKSGAGLKTLSIHCGEQGVHGNGGEAGGGIAHCVGDNEFAPMQQGAAGINDVRHIAFALGFVGAQQWFAQPANDSRGIV